MCLNWTLACFPLSVVCLGTLSTCSLQICVCVFLLRIADQWRKRLPEYVCSPTANILLLCFGSFNYVQCENRPNQISNGPKVSISLGFGLGKHTGTCESAFTFQKRAYNLWKVSEGNVSYDCEAVLTGWGRSPDVQINQSYREWWEFRDLGWEGRHGTRFTCPQPAVSQLHTLQSTAINPSQLTLVCHKLTGPAWPFVTWNCSQHGISNMDSEFTWILTPL